MKPTVPAKRCSPTPGHSSGRACPTTQRGAPTSRKSGTEGGKHPHSCVTHPPTYLPTYLATYPPVLVQQTVILTGLWLSSTRGLTSSLQFRSDAAHREARASRATTTFAAMVSDSRQPGINTNVGDPVRRSSSRETRGGVV